MKESKGFCLASRVGYLSSLNHNDGGLEMKYLHLPQIIIFILIRKHYVGPILKFEF